MTDEEIRVMNFELWGLYTLQRSATLNFRYYGRRSSDVKWWNTRFQVVAGIGSLGTVAGFLSFGGTEAGKWISALVGAIAAVCSSLPRLLGYSDKIERFERLHFAYCELFQLAKRLALDIRRTGALTDEQLGSAKLLHDIYSRLGQLDTSDRNDKLVAECEAVVRAQFPDECLWYAAYDGETGEDDADPAPRPEGEPAASS